MRYRKTLISVIAAASVVTAAGAARAVTIDDGTLGPASGILPSTGSVTVDPEGGYATVDGNEGNIAAEHLHEWFNGYVSVGEGEDDGGPGVCMSGAENREYYTTDERSQECNEDLLTNDQRPIDNSPV